MGRFQRIFYLERRRRGSMRAVSRAVQTAQEQGATLTLAGVPRGRLARLVEFAGTFDVPVRRLDLAEPGGITTEVRGEHDLVMTVARTRRSMGPFGLSALDRELLRNCTCPLWFLHPAQYGSTRVILAAVDVSVPDRQGMNRQVLRTAAELTEGSGAALCVVHCWSVLGESLLASRTRGGSPSTADRVRARTERTRARRIEALLAAEGVPTSTRVVLRKAGVVPGLIDTAWSLEADTVVVGTAPRTGISALLLGNSAEGLLGRVPASVLVVPVGRAPEPRALPRRRSAAGPPTALVTGAGRGGRVP